MDRFYIADTAVRNRDTNDTKRRRFGMRFSDWDSLPSSQQDVFHAKATESINRTISEKCPIETFDVHYDIITIDGNWSTVQPLARL